ncbi:MAG: HAMP domain-containing histidine kinase [Actinobacteria bacterium]|nr:HAMP domain-containing histidine kinase [Actinomycetota bacterium]
MDGSDPTPSRDAAFDLLPEAVVVVGREDRRIRHVNDRAVALLAVGRDDLGEPFAKAVPLIDDAGNVCSDVIAPAGRSVDRLAERVLRVVLPDGRKRPVSVAGRIVGDEVVLTFRSAGRRERVDAARSDLVATVSHEIRSPLTSVKGFTKTLLLKWERFSDEQKRTMLETVNEDADRVTRLLGELLDVSRIDAGRVQLHRQRVDVGAVALRVAEKVSHRPEGAGRDVSIVAAGELPSIHADPDKVEQILTNLVENALKYAPESSVRVEVSADGASGGVHIAVSDDGPGIPHDQTRRIFEKFGRGRGQRRAGTGLGLYITRGLAHAMGGDVTCESTVDVGSTFRVRLPAGGFEFDPDGD